MEACKVGTGAPVPSLVSVVATGWETGSTLETEGWTYVAYRQSPQSGEDICCKEYKSRRVVSNKGTHLESSEESAIGKDERESEKENLSGHSGISAESITTRIM